MNVRILMAVTTLASVGMLSSEALAQSCNVDTDCQCGDVCSWQGANASNHICVNAGTGDPGWCDSTGNCLYNSQTCTTSSHSCAPAVSSLSVCSTPTNCLNDANCPCGDVCAYDQIQQNDGNPLCWAANTGDVGWCSASDTTCLYQAQTCNGTECQPAWSATSVCVNSTTTAGNSTTTGAAATTAAATGTTSAAATTAAAAGTTGAASGTTAAAAGTTGAASGTTAAAAGTTGAASGTTAAAAGTTAAAASTTSGTASSTGGASSGTTSGGANTCTNDDDCACGQLCAWDQGTAHHCVTATTTEPGWCTASSSTNTCLYDGQTCKGTACSPAWSSASVCDKSTTSATSGTTTGADGGTGSGGGGCSTAPGAFALIAAVLGLGLLRRRRA